MKRLIYILFFLLCLSAVVVGEVSKTARTIIQNESGFVSIEPLTFYFHKGNYFDRLELRSSEALIWYSFHAADSNAAEKPLFIFFNGGPGGAASSGVMSMSTTRYMLDEDPKGGDINAFLPNPDSWTRLGNLLYIDPRTSGFSYNLKQGVTDIGSRFWEFNAQNFNCYFDAGDFIRVLLRFLGQHPDLQDNPVVIVGESYGGTRSTTMLHLLLNYDDYGRGETIYQDQALVDEIQEHFNVVFPEYKNEVVPPEVIVRQFGHQILIQPAVAYSYQLEEQDQMYRQPGSVIFKIAEETGVPFDPDSVENILGYVRDVIGRDYYIYTKPANWLMGYFEKASRALRYVANLNLITGVEATLIPQFYANLRNSAYKIIDENSSWALPHDPSLPFELTVDLFKTAGESWEEQSQIGDMNYFFGQLLPWDRYHVDINLNATSAFNYYNVASFRGYDIHFYDHRFGRMFLKNVALVHTFITNAALDLVVYSQAIAPSLARYEDIIESSTYDEQSINGEERPGTIILRYRSGAFSDISDPGTRIIRFPIYSTSCHAVSWTQPSEFLQDAADWLVQHGIIFD